jgi:hypothetical protein
VTMHEGEFIDPPERAQATGVGPTSRRPRQRAKGGRALARAGIAKAYSATSRAHRPIAPSPHRPIAPSPRRAPRPKLHR